MERDDCLNAEITPLDISTHTLTWSVTALKFYNDKTTLISTHTLTWSVTQMVKLTQYVNRISTHTLTWSVTYN